jgi:hypothetical protein
MVPTRTTRAIGWALPLLVFAAGCGADEPSGAGSEATSGGVEGCAPGEMPLEDGGCQPAGIPPHLCGAGFEPDGTMGCNPVLPPAACPAGQMAIPGDVACRPVAICPDGEYGDAPIEGTTQFVNGSYGGTDSDGSQAKPWTRIQDAIDAAAPGAVVAIAAGSYVEWIDLRFKALRIWGHCPSTVEIVGDSTGFAAVFLEDGIAGTEVRNLRITGAQVGITLSGSENVLVDQVWIHGTKSRGINLQNDWGPTAMTVTRSLIEGAAEFGVYVSGSRLVLEDSLVRDTQAAYGNFGRGLNVQGDPVSKVRSDARVRGSLLERNREVAVYIAGSDASIERTVVRDTLPQESDGLFGRGIGVEDEVETGESSAAQITASVLERNRDVGVMIGRSTAIIEATVVRDTVQADADQKGGRGIVVQPFDGMPSDAIIRWSLLERNVEVGLFLAGSIGSVEGLRVRDTRSSPLMLDRGAGIALQAQLTGQPVSLKWCIAERNREIGISFNDYDGSIEASAVFDTQPTEGAGEFGDGVAVSTQATPRAVSVTGSLVRGSGRAAVSAFGSAVSLRGNMLDCNAIDLDVEATITEGSFSDQGDNRCGCGEESRACKAVTSGLAPPSPLPPSE